MNLSSIDPRNGEHAARRGWDAVVIGAGPSGSVAAHALARAGRAVLLVDRSVFPRRKACGGCLAPAGVLALEQAGLGAALRGALPIRSCTLRIGRARVCLPAPGYRVIERDVLDHRLAGAAEQAGASLLLGWSARVRADGRVGLSRAAQDPSGTRESVDLRPRLVVVADGLGGGSLQDHPEFKERISRTSRMGLAARIARSPVPLVADQIAMLCGPEGYVGIARLPGGEVGVGAALDPGAVRSAGGPGELAARIALACGGDGDVMRRASWHGTPLLTRARRRVESGTVYVLGDSAAYVEPFTGEGMTWSIRGALLGAAIVEDRLDGRAPAGAWARAHQQLFRAPHRRCRLAAALLRRHRLLAGIGQVAGRWPAVARWATAALGPSHPLPGRGATA